MGGVFFHNEGNYPLEILRYKEHWVIIEHLYNRHTVPQLKIWGLEARTSAATMMQKIMLNYYNSFSCLSFCICGPWQQAQQILWTPSEIMTYLEIVLPANFHKVKADMWSMSVHSFLWGAAGMLTEVVAFLSVLGRNPPPFFFFTWESLFPLWKEYF